MSGRTRHRRRRPGRRGWLTRAEPPDAVFAHNDLMALGAMRVLAVWTTAPGVQMYTGDTLDGGLRSCDGTA